MAGKATPLKAALLDQTLIAGLGNIYVCEALHRAGTFAAPDRRHAGAEGWRRRPRVRCGSPPAIKAVLTEAVEAGGSSLRDYRHTDGALGTFQHGFRAYDREHDPMPEPALPRHDRPHRAERTLDLLLRGVPAVR